MAMVDLYRALMKEAVRVFAQEKERRKRAIHLRLKMHHGPSKSFGNFQKRIEH